MSKISIIFELQDTITQLKSIERKIIIIEAAIEKSRKDKLFNTVAFIFFTFIALEYAVMIGIIISLFFY